MRTWREVRNFAWHRNNDPVPKSQYQL